MRYRDLKDERDAAIARAVEAERMSMRSEFERVTREFEEEKAKLLAESDERAKNHYRRGFNDGLATMAQEVTECMRARKYISNAEVVLADNFSEPGDFKTMVDDMLAQADKELLTKSPEETFCERLYESGVRRAEQESVIQESSKKENGT
jgi:hypothetical protein